MKSFNENTKRQSADQHLITLIESKQRLTTKQRRPRLALDGYKKNRSSEASVLCSSDLMFRSKYRSASGPSLLRSPSPRLPHGFNYDISKTSLLYIVPNMLLASEDIKQKQNERTNETSCWSLSISSSEVNKRVACVQTADANRVKCPGPVVAFNCCGELVGPSGKALG